MPTYTYQVLDEDGEPTGDTEDHFFHHHDKPDRFTGEDGRERVYDLRGTMMSVYTTPNGLWPRVVHAFSGTPAMADDLRKAFPDCNVNRHGDVEVPNKSVERKHLKRLNLGDNSSDRRKRKKKGLF